MTEESATSGGDGSTSDGAGWRADDEHRRRCDWVGGELFELITRTDLPPSRPLRVYPPVRPGEPVPAAFKVAPEYPEEVFGSRADELYGETECVPFVVTDPEGRRYEVEVEVRVSPLPPAEVQLAQHDRDVLRVAAVTAGSRIPVQGGSLADRARAAGVEVVDGGEPRRAQGSGEFGGW